MKAKLVLSYRWFDMIASGEKKEEYREIKPTFVKAFSKPITQVEFYRGYQKNRQQMTVEVLEITKGTARPEWSDSKLFDPNQEVFILKLGKILETNFNQEEQC